MNNALTIIDVNDAATELEITHRLYAHDLEQAFGLNAANLDYFESAEGSQKLDKYLRENFKIQYKTAPIDLVFVGAQTDFDMVYGYYTARFDAQKPIVLNSEILFEYNENQSNLVNIHFNGATKSYNFTHNKADIITKIDKAAW